MNIDQAYRRIEAILHLKGRPGIPQKLNAESVLEIKRMLSDGKYLQKAVAYKFKISRKTVSDIATGKLWAHVTDRLHPADGNRAA